MKMFFRIVLFVLIISCKSSKESNESIDIVDKKVISDIDQNPVTCPKNHTDSIIPIIYGFPTKESFQKEDSGLVYLGGCEISNDSPLWFCKIHNLSF